MNSNIAIFCPNPNSVEAALKNSKILKGRYKNNRPSDWAFKHMPVIPILYKQSVASKKYDPDYLYQYLINAWKENKNPEYLEKISEVGKKMVRIQIQTRAKKLVLDFCREIHTFGMLFMSGFFDYVNYEKGNDLSMNLDYSACPIGIDVNMGIQSQMRAPWINTDWDALKRQRRIRRDEIKKDGSIFTGPLFFLVNGDLPVKKCPNTGAWLFTNEHISALIEDIKSELGGDMDAPVIGINTLF